MREVWRCRLIFCESHPSPESGPGRSRTEIAMTKPHIKQREFQDLNITALERHKRSGKTLIAWYNTLPGGLMQFHSWKDQALPNILWACVVATSLARDDYLAAFRLVAAAMRENVPADSKPYVVHNHLSTLSYEDFANALSPIKQFPDAYRALSSLRLVESLPDHKHWMEFTSATMMENPWDILARAVVTPMDHQSQMATDIRWLKLIQLAISGRVQFPEEQGELIEEIRLYPDHGDMRAVRPMIRATEMAFRMMEYGKELPEGTPESRHEEFWAECYTKTGCIVPEHGKPSKPTHADLLSELNEVGVALAQHFEQCSPTTGPDPRKDATFGLTLYALGVSMECAASYAHQLPFGRAYLRTVVECLITLKYLVQKDNDTIWRKYRSFGLGQAKLSFLKLIREDDVPDFVSLQNLHDLANEDGWMEFQNVDLGSWEDMNLRQMATECGIKDLYDKFYTWPSGFAHGQWAAVRDSVFATCLNPLHRFHRVPSPPNVLPSVLFDICKLINAMLDQVSSAYPPFKRRVKWHNRPVEQKPLAEAG
jgi:hypothetical protein